MKKCYISLILAIMALCVLASAADVSGTANLTTATITALGDVDTERVRSINFPRIDNGNYYSYGSTQLWKGKGVIPLVLDFPNTIVDGGVAVYFSWFGYVTGDAYITVPPDIIYNSDGNFLGNNYLVRYHSGQTTDDVIPTVDSTVTSFIPNFPSPNNGKGINTTYGVSVSLKFTVNDFDGYANGFTVLTDSYPVLWYTDLNYSYTTQGWWYPTGIVIPTMRVVTGAITDIERYEQIVDSVIGVSDELIALRGDLVAVAQEIYLKTYDIDESVIVLKEIVSEIKQQVTSTNTTVNNMYSQWTTRLNSIRTSLLSIDETTMSMQAVLEEIFTILEAQFRDPYEGEDPDDIPNPTEEQREEVQQGLNELNRPDVDETSDSVNESLDGIDFEATNDFFEVVFGNGFVITMLMLTLSLAFVGYVLFGKR